MHKNISQVLGNYMQVETESDNCPVPSCTKIAAHHLQNNVGCFWPKELHEQSLPGGAEVAKFVLCCRHLSRTQAAHTLPPPYLQWLWPALACSTVKPMLQFLHLLLVLLLAATEGQDR